MNREILMMHGYPGSGKSSVAQGYIAKGFIRVNRDDIGCSLDQLVPLVEKELAQTGRSVILDNTYPTAESRRSMIALAKKLGIPAVALVLETTIEDAQRNVCQRMLERHGRLVDASQMKALKDPGLFPPTVQYHHKKVVETPTLEEGFSEIRRVPFVRRPSIHTGKGIILDYDGTLRRSKSGSKWPMSKEDIEIIPGRAEVLKDLVRQGYVLCGASNQSIVSKGEISVEKMRELFDHTNKLLGVDIDVMFCPHQSHPIACFCRKPMPGMAVALMEKHKLNSHNVLMIGDMTLSYTRRVSYTWHNC